MSFRLVPKSVTLNDLERHNGLTLCYSTEFGNALQKTICGGIYARVYCILVRVQCRRKVGSRSLSHLLMSFLYVMAARRLVDQYREISNAQRSKQATHVC